MNLISILLTIILFSNMYCVCGSDEEDIDISGSDSLDKQMIATKEEFRILFKEKRRQQISAVKTLESFGKYEQKYSMISNIFGKLFEVEEKAKQAIEDSEYVLGADLPKEAPVLEALSHIVENCAFFGDIVLRLPDISHRVLRDNHKYVSLYKWCISFSMATDLCDKSTQKMFDLLAQELELVPKNQSYINPYKKSNKSKGKTIDANVVNSEDNNMKSHKNKKSIKRGPRLSKTRTEL